MWINQDADHGLVKGRGGVLLKKVEVLFLTQDSWDVFLITFCFRLLGGSEAVFWVGALSVVIVRGDKKI